MSTIHMNPAIDATHTLFSKDGAKISYLTIGSGPSVIVIPGGLSTASDCTAFSLVTVTADLLLWK